MSGRPLSVVALQHDIVWEDRDATLEKLEEPVRHAATDADLVVLAEMFAVGFTMSPAVAESPDGPTTRWLLDRASTYGAWIAGSVPVVLDGAAKPSNVFTLASPDGTVHRYAKRHPFSYAREDEHYRPGDRHMTVDVEGVRTSLTVCYDLRFSDSYTPIAQDTDLYLVVASWPDTRSQHWRALLQARAIENQAYVVGVNRVGTGGGLRYDGGTRIIDPMGVVSAVEGGELSLGGEIDASYVARVRSELPFLQDRR